MISLTTFGMGRTRVMLSLLEQKPNDDQRHIYGFKAKQHKFKRSLLSPYGDWRGDIDSFFHSCSVLYLISFTE
ncbi:hypothetical protein EUTSA_v10016100mg [Eutrema salsugineum]|uniref:Uncharacterized protein n=1 Tax=Eutrema salsugineum TaxID=72664 RepID=V4LPE8_EUTSA|nr:hypothetical protein EUTSA_v10016100mg [Eutrema salsugineum]